MSLALEFLALERSRWRIGCGFALAGLAIALWYLGLHAAPDSGRLYWEYAGRMLHAPVTNGYIEWVQHRVGEPPALASAARAARRLAPYSDFPSEYPPGSLLYFLAVRYFSDDVFGFSRLIHMCSAALFFLVMAIALRSVRKLYLLHGSRNLFLLYLALPFVAISPILIGPFALSRFDMLPTFLAISGLALFLENVPLAAVFMLGLGASAKLWPGIFIPLLFANYWHSGSSRTKLIAMLALGFVGFAIPHVIMICLGTHPVDIFNYLKFLGDRPPQVESFVANLVVILSHITGMPVTGRFDFGSQNIYSAYSVYIIRLASIINVALLLFAYIIVLKKSNLYKSRVPSEIVTIFACGFCLCVTMLCSRVFSSEYMMWPLPLVVLLFLNRGGAIGVIAFTVALMLLKPIYWEYDDLVAAGLNGTLICLGKNIMFAIVAGVFGSQMMHYRPARIAGSPP